MKALSKYFINGLIVITPMVFTVFVVMQIFSVAEGLLGRHLPIHFPGVGLIAAILLILLVGWLSSLWILKSILNYIDRLVGSIPVVKFIYNSVKQLSAAVFESQQLFKHAVLVPYPHPGVKALGFVLPTLTEPLAKNFTEEYVCVFVPMSLNMTAGFNIMVPKRDIIPLDVTGESALQYVLTAGAVMPRGNE
ncbi:Hypothetical protein LUCI_1294 [Lucifera butyrica]|uniref:DUF502 domain-containing protein n=1 Tax=Lucifera butyrica TaxID=1351585 RepID=A0A498R4K8_9FIRM|nr:DUF502 domain-containing protein [Lucifera butyrica]VBB06079.1 Hypothetical protein LUCI_1294 [Lucifera butyrica]